LDLLDSQDLPFMNTDLLRSLIWHTMPVDGGRIVNVQYADSYDDNGGNGKLYRRTLDTSDGALCYEVADVLPDADNFEPWNNQLPQHGEWRAA
jgi:hypothetical protein